MHVSEMDNIGFRTMFYANIFTHFKQCRYIHTAVFILRKGIPCFSIIEIQLKLLKGKGWVSPLAMFTWTQSESNPIFLIGRQRQNL